MEVAQFAENGHRAYQEMTLKGVLLDCGDSGVRCRRRTGCESTEEEEEGFLSLYDCFLFTNLLKNGLGRIAFPLTI